MKFVIRELSPIDLDPLYHLLNQPEIAYLTNHPIESYEDFIQQYRLYTEEKAIDLKIFVILINEQIIGKMELAYDLEHRTGMFEIVIGKKDYWGTGIASKALNVLLAYGFNNLRLNKISCEVFGYNGRSISFMEKNGLRLEGVLREDRFIHNQFIDVYLFSILKSEFIDLE